MRLAAYAWGAFFSVWQQVLGFYIPKSLHFVLGGAVFYLYLEAALEAAK